MDFEWTEVSLRDRQTPEDVLEAWLTARELLDSPSEVTQIQAVMILRKIGRTWRGYRESAVVVLDDFAKRFPEEDQRNRVAVGACVELSGAE